MENNEKQQKWGETISRIIKERDLYGRSYTRGVALIIGATEGRFDFDMLDELSEELELYIGEELINAMEKRGLHTEAGDLVNLVDLAVLDEIARVLIGEAEEY